MPSNHTVLIPSTTFGTATGNYDGATDNFVTDKARGDGYYGYTDGLHTMAYFLAGFTGNIKLQATLALTPSEADWFDITGTDVNAATPTTASGSVNFTGNFVWIRASVDTFSAGTIIKLMFNY